MDQGNTRPLLGDFIHVCPFVGDALIDEHDDEIIHCRCYTTREFLDAQDRRAIELDAERIPQRTRSSMNLPILRAEWRAFKREFEAGGWRWFVLGMMTAQCIVMAVFLISYQYLN